MQSGALTMVMDVISTGAVESWPVLPQLQDVRFNIVGMHQAAESETDMRISFIPVKPAITLEVEAVSPTDFKFERFFVSYPLIRWLWTLL